jgi:AraC-like DNA-binding protein
MVRLLVRAMAAHGLEPPPPPAADYRMPESHVPLAYKRSVVESVLRQGGLGTLLLLAQRVEMLAGDPVHGALLGAASVPALIARWQRLERYVHSRHQVCVVSSGPDFISLQHQARTGIAPGPLPAESLAVVGVLAGASQAIGTTALQLEIGAPGAGIPLAVLHGTPLSATDLLAQLAPVVARGEAHHWTLRWTAGTDSDGAEPHTRAGTPPKAFTTLCDALPWPPLALQLARRVLRDPAAVHTVDALAGEVGMSPRSLQRALAQWGLGCRQVVAEARTRVAAQWLLEGAHGLAEIGFACGFADQPHFTREFSRYVGLPPARYRQAFAAAAASDTLLGQ